LAEAASEPNDIIGSIRTQLEGLKRTEDGMLLYRLIERGLGKRPEQGGDTDDAFLTFLYTLLERYAKNRDGDPITRIKVRVIQQRITPHLLAAEAEPAASPAPPPVAVTEEEPEAEQEMEEASPPATAAEPVNAQPADDISAVVSPVTDEPGMPEDEPGLELEVPTQHPNHEEILPELELTDEMKSSMAEEQAPKQPVQKSEEKPKPAPPKKVEPSSIDKPKPKPVASKPEPPKKTQPKPEPPKKPIKLELVEPTDLTQPHMAKIVKTEDEYDIELGGDSPKPAAVNKKPQPRAPEKTVPAKAAATPAPRKAVGELVPKEVVPPAPGKTKPKAKTQDKTGGPPSQERVEKLHEAFVHKMAESITRSQEYHRLLRSHMKAIELADNEDDFKDLKSLLVRGMEDLLKGNEVLNRDLDATNHYLKIARLDRALLKDELGRIRDNTTVDALTALQNREAFVAQLQSEISRVNRYGFSFAIAILDIDDLKAINETYGRDAGDEILRCYARQILSQFRSYDLVARNKNDEFLLMFPNTQKEGAIRAVEKAQKQAANLFINHKDKSIKVPTFTSVLTIYTPGDQPETLLKRTSEALAQAQKKGRGQVVLALPTS
jgi:diguanylate cyclase (GGDEF)-like protein